MHQRTLSCPDCSAQLQAVNHEGVEVDVCPAGHGVWLDKGELEQVVASEAVDRPASEEQAELEKAGRAMSEVMEQVRSEATRACPVCRGAMQKRDYPGSAIVMDVCHGYWLDHGELARIEAFGEGTRRTATIDEQVATSGQRMPTSVRGIPIPPDLLGGALRSAAPPR